MNHANVSLAIAKCLPAMHDPIAAANASSPVIGLAALGGMTQNAFTFHTPDRLPLCIQVNTDIRAFRLNVMVQG